MFVGCSSMLHHHLQLGVFIALKDPHGVQAVGLVAQVKREAIALHRAEILYQLASGVVDGEAIDE